MITSQRPHQFNYRCGLVVYWDVLLSVRGVGVIITLYYPSYLLCGDTIFLCDDFGFYTGVMGGEDFGFCKVAELVHPRGDFYHIIPDYCTGNEMKLKQVVGIDN